MKHLILGTLKEFLKRGEGSQVPTEDLGVRLLYGCTSRRAGSLVRRALWHTLDYLTA